jgi:hypothetical protein
MRVLLICVVAALAGSPGFQEAVTDLDGHRVQALDARPGVVATVLVFLRTDCPVASQAAPAIERIHRDNSPRGVRVWLVFIDPAETAAMARDHLRAFGLHAPALRDPEHALVRQTGVGVTPEAALYLHDAPTPRLVYRGRLDDSVVRLGIRRPRPTRRDLQEAIDKALAGGIAEPIITPATGCAIAGVE